MVGPRRRRPARPARRPWRRPGLNSRHHPLALLLLLLLGLARHRRRAPTLPAPPQASPRRGGAREVPPHPLARPAHPQRPTWPARLPPALSPLVVVARRPVRALLAPVQLSRSPAPPAARRSSSSTARLGRRRGRCRRPNQRLWPALLARRRPLRLLPCLAPPSRPRGPLRRPLLLLLLLLLRRPRPRHAPWWLPLHPLPLPLPLHPRPRPRPPR